MVFLGPSTPCQRLSRALHKAPRPTGVSGSPEGGPGDGRSLRGAVHRHLGSRQPRGRGRHHRAVLRLLRAHGEVSGRDSSLYISQAGESVSSQRYSFCYRERFRPKLKRLYSTLYTSQNFFIAYQIFLFQRPVLFKPPWIRPVLIHTTTWVYESHLTSFIIKMF